MISLKLRFRAAAICLAAILVLGILPSGQVYADDGATDSITATETELVASDLGQEDAAAQDTASEEAEAEPTETLAPDLTQETVDQEPEAEPEPTETPAPDLTQETTDQELEEEPEPTETPAPDSTPDTDLDEQEEEPTETSDPDVTEDAASEEMDVETASDEMTEDLAEATDDLTLTIKNIMMGVPEDSQDTLSYTIYLWDPSITSTSDSSRALTGSYGDATFTSTNVYYYRAADIGLPSSGYYGCATVELSPDESVVITGLPKGCNYFVKIDATYLYYIRHLSDTTGSEDALYGTVYVQGASIDNYVEYVNAYGPHSLRLGVETISSNASSVDDEFEFTVYFYKHGSSANTPLFSEDDYPIEIDAYGEGDIAAPNLGTTMTLEKTDSIQLNGLSIYGVYNAVTFKLKHGQSVVFKNLGTNFGYYVVQSPNIHYALYTYKSKSIYTKYTTQASYTDYSFGSQYVYLNNCNLRATMTFENAQVNLGITKKVENSDTTRSFVFNVFFAQLNIDTGQYSPLPEGDYTLTYSGSNLTGEEPTSVHIQQRSDISHADLTTEDWYGNTTTSTWSVAQISLAAGQTVTIKGLPLGVFYDIVEVPVANYTVSATDLVNAYVGSNNNVYSGSYLMADASATIVNTYNPPEGIDLTLSKTVTGNWGDKTKAFSFSITLTDASGAPLSDWDVPVLLPDQTKTVRTTDASGGLTLSLAHGQSLTLQDLPQGTRYTITETDAGNYITSFSVTGGSHDPAAEYTQSGALDSEEDVTVQVTNNFEIVPTGIETELQPFVLTLALALAGLLWLVLSKKHKPV
jgi:hypothetical protein